MFEKLINHLISSKYSKSNPKHPSQYPISKNKSILHLIIFKSCSIQIFNFLIYSIKHFFSSSCSSYFPFYYLVHHHFHFFLFNSRFSSTFLMFVSLDLTTIIAIATNFNVHGNDEAFCRILKHFVKTLSIEHDWK